MLADDFIIRINSIIFNGIRDYPYPYYSLKYARDIALHRLSCAGFVPFLDADRNIIVNGEMFKIYRNRTWKNYDVRHIGPAPENV